MKKFLAMALTGVMCVGLLAGCSNGSSGTTSAPSGGSSASTPASSTAGADGAIKIGGIGPLTGSAATYGIATKQGAEIAVDEINALGGIQLSLEFQDDEGDAEKAINAYNALKEWGMQISLGSVTSQPGVSTSALAFEDRIFTMTPSGSSPDVISGKDNVYQMCFSDPNQGLASAQYITEQGLGEKVFIIWKNDDVYSTGIKEQFVKEAETLGLEVVGDATFTTDTATDFSVQLTQAQQAGADLLFLPIYYTPASVILTQANAMGYAPTFFGVDGMDGILTAENFDASLAEGVYLLTPFSADSEDEMTQNFVAEYQDRFGEIPNQFGADAYDAIYTLYQAIQAAGATADMSNEEICDALIEVMPTLAVTGLTSAGSEMTWDENGAVSKDPTAVIIENGTYVTP